MIHIGLLYHGGGVSWAEYLKNLLLKDERQKFTVILLDLSDYENQSQVLELMSSCFVILLLVTPDMFSFMLEMTWLDDHYKTIPQHRCLVSILSFIEDAEYLALQQAYSSSVRWVKLHLSESAQSNVKMVAEIIDLVEKAEKSENVPKPKKRKTLGNPKTNGGPEVIDICPSKVYTDQEKVAVLFKGEVVGTIQIGFKGCEHRIETEQLNPYTVTFITPVIMPACKLINIYYDSILIASKPFSFIKPNQVSYQSLEFLMQTLAVEDRTELDVKLCDIFERSLPADGSLNSVFNSILSTSISSSRENEQPCEYPTVLHYSAAHGLTEFTSLLLDNPVSMIAFEIKNQDGYNPADMADANDHCDLAHYIRDFTDAKAVVDACGNYISMMNPTSISGYFNVPSYNITEPNSEEIYSRALEEEDIKDSISKFIQEDARAPPPRSHPLPPIPPPHRKYSLDNSVRVVPLMKSISSSSLVPPSRNKKYSNPNDNSTTQSAPCDEYTHGDPAEFIGIYETQKRLSSGAVGSTAQQELIDLQNLVKNKEFTIEDALLIFNSWKDRPSSRSFMDRKKSLQQLRQVESSKTTTKNQNKIYQRLASFRKMKRKNKREYIISEPINTRCSNISTGSSSSDSRTSSTSVPDLNEITFSDNECDNPPQLRPRTSASRYQAMDTRKSRKDMYLEYRVEDEDEDIPPVPPRTYILSQINKHPPPV